MKKKLVSILLCVAMVAAMITGCGDKKAEEDTSGAAQTSAPAGQQDTACLLYTSRTLIMQVKNSTLPDSRSMRYITMTVNRNWTKRRIQ